jgi:acyl-[acyl carrier protein]--UDP-N-acetylglucosamine O-acyltransferase
LINIAENVTIGTFVTLETKVTVVTRRLYVKLANKIVIKVHIPVCDNTEYYLGCVERLRTS